jgi:hypothetical protein
LYVAHSVGPYTHPSLAFANRTLPTEPDDGDEADAKGAGGAAVAAQVLLPFAVVTTMALHGAVVQGEVPRTKPCEAEIKLTDAGLKCAGTGAAAASAPVANAAALTSSTVQAIFMVPMAERSA